MESEKKYIHIEMKKYDEIFDKWVEETKPYVDQFNLEVVMKRFDNSCGLIHAETEFDEVDYDNHYRFEVIDGSKFIVSALRYSLHTDDIDV